MYKKILIATDGSNHVNRAASIIIGFHKKWNSKITIFHSIKHMLQKVYPPSHGWSLPYASDTYFQIISPSKPILIEEEKDPKITRISVREVEEIGENILFSKKSIFEEVGVPAEIRLITEEEPEDYIMKTVKKEKFDLIVVGIKGVHSKLSQIFIGSVAEEVVKKAPCDVLVIR
ncbi:MAG: universal stress protein [Candidatus Thorarchaeota archaeon]